MILYFIILLVDRVLKYFSDAQVCYQTKIKSDRDQIFSKLKAYPD